MDAMPTWLQYLDILALDRMAYYVAYQILNGRSATMTKLAFFKAKAELQEGSFREATSNSGSFPSAMPSAMPSAKDFHTTSLVIKSHRRVGLLVRGECITVSQQSAAGGIRRS